MEFPNSMLFSISKWLAQKLTIFKSTTPNLAINNAMSITSFAQMKQSKRFGHVRNDEIFNLDLGSAAGP